MNNCNVPSSIPPNRNTLTYFMDRYDSMPAEFRKIFQDAPYNLLYADDTFTETDLCQLKYDMLISLYEGCKESFGSDHPDLDRLYTDIVEFRITFFDNLYG